MSFEISYYEGKYVIVDEDSYFYEDSEGNGRGWKIGKTTPYDGPYFKVNYVAPGARYPIHIRGRNNDLGWVEPYAILEVKAVSARFGY